MFSHGTDDNNMVVKYKKDTVFLLCPPCDECMFLLQYKCIIYELETLSSSKNISLRTPELQGNSSC